MSVCRLLLLLGAVTWTACAQEPGLKSFDNGLIRFAYPAGWSVETGTNPPSVIIRPPATAPGQAVLLLFGKLPAGERCALASQHQDFTGVHKPNLVDWGMSGGPSEQFDAGPSMTSAYRTYYGDGRSLLTSICRDAFYVHSIAASNPFRPDVMEGRSRILKSLQFGSGPTIVGAWWVRGGGWNLHFNPDRTLVSHSWGEAPIYGSWRLEGANLTLAWSSRRRPPVGGNCKADFTNVNLVLNCDGQSWAFERSER